MKDVINFFLSIILGYVLVFVLFHIFLEILRILYPSLFNFILDLSTTKIYMFNTKILFIQLLGVFIAWMMISFVMYKFMKRTILK